MMYTDHEMEQLMSPVARNKGDLKKIKEMKQEGVLPFNHYWYVDSAGNCRCLHNDKIFSQSAEGVSLAPERKKAIGWGVGSYSITSPPETFRPPIVVFIRRYNHKNGLIFLHEET